MLTKKKVQPVQTGIVSFIVFTSPEELICPMWLDLFHDMVTLGMLTLFSCIDEVHQFVEYGLSFCKDFALLKDRIFSKLIVENNNHDNENAQHDVTKLRVSFLCMTDLLT